MVDSVGKIQLGKNGISPNFISSLKCQFKKHNNVKVVVLKSAGHEREKVKEYSEKILKKMGEKFTSRVIGFTIALKKWRKARK
jgi:RNA-binding protein YhbY